MTTPNIDPGEEILRITFKEKHTAHQISLISPLSRKYQGIKYVLKFNSSLLSLRILAKGREGERELPLPWIRELCRNKQQWYI